MPEKVKEMIADMEAIIQKNFDRVKTPLMQDGKMELCEMGKMIDIVKDLSEAMKNVVKIKKYYTEHTETML